MILVGTRAGLFRVSDTHGQWSAERLLATDKPIMSLAVDASGEKIYIGFYQGGMCASRDAGRSWRPIGANLPYQDVRTLALHPDDPDTVYAGTEPAALYVSRDNGQRFEELTAVRTHPAAKDWAFPIRPKLGHVRTLAFHPDDPQTFYVGIEVGSLLKTTDGGQTFVEAPDCGHDIHRALVLEDPARTVLVTTGLDTNAYKRTGYEGQFRSGNGGANYLQSNTGLGAYKYCEDAICAEPGRPQRVYLATARGIPPYWASMTRMVLGAALGHFAYFVTPSRLRRRSGAEVVLSASDDGGANWQRLETEGLPTPLFDMVWALAVAPDPGRPQLYLGTTGGDLYLGEPGGQSWRKALSGLPVITQLHALAA